MALGGLSSTYSNQQASDESMKVVTKQQYDHVVSVCVQSSVTPSDQRGSYDPADDPPTQEPTEDTTSVSHDPGSHDPAAGSHDPTKAGEEQVTTDHQYIYKGDSNVICVQLFCMDEAYEMRCDHYHVIHQYITYYGTGHVISSLEYFSVSQ